MSAVPPALARARSHDRLDAFAMSILVVLCALWGLQQVAVKLAAAQGIAPLVQATVRSAGAAGLLFVWVLGREGRRSARRLVAVDEALGPGLIIAAMFAAEFVCLFTGLTMTSASRGVVFLYTAPFFTALGTHFVVRSERLRTREVVGLVIAFGGVAITFADGFLGGGGSLAGDALCAAAAAAWGLTTVYIKATPALMRAPAPRLLFLQLAGSVPVLLIAALWSGQLATFPDATPLAWAALGYQTAIVAFASYLAWFWLVLAYPANRLAGFTFLTPFFGILAGGLLLGEHVGPAILAGLAAIAVGLRLLNPPARLQHSLSG